MSKHSTRDLDAVYQALANATRRRILTRLCRGECTVGQLAEPFDMTLAGVSKHIKVLEKAGLVSKRSQGPEHICEIRFEPIRTAAALVHYFEQFLPVEVPEAAQADGAAYTPEEAAAPAEKVLQKVEEKTLEIA